MNVYVRKCNYGYSIGWLEEGRAREHRLELIADNQVRNDEGLHLASFNSISRELRNDYRKI